MGSCATWNAWSRLPMLAQLQRQVIIRTGDANRTLHAVGLYFTSRCRSRWMLRSPGEGTLLSSRPEPHGTPACSEMRFESPHHPANQGCINRVHNIAYGENGWHLRLPSVLCRLPLRVRLTKRLSRTLDHPGRANLKHILWPIFVPERFVPKWVGSIV